MPLQHSVGHSDYRCGVVLEQFSNGFGVGLGGFLEDVVFRQRKGLTAEKFAVWKQARFSAIRSRTRLARRWSWTAFRGGLVLGWSRLRFWVYLAVPPGPLHFDHKSVFPTACGELSPI